MQYSIDYIQAYRYMTQKTSYTSTEGPPVALKARPASPIHPGRGAELPRSSPTPGMVGELQ